MPASGRLDDHPPPLHSELSVNDLSIVGNEVWAVGMHGVPAPALTAHTTGGDPWQLVSYPSTGTAVHIQLAGVHAIASGDVWAVGWEGLLHSNTERTHIAHSDGSTWQRVESPDFGDNSHLSDVAAWGRDDAFAVGSRLPHSSSSPSGPLGLPPAAAWDTLAARWDGARWAAVPGPGRGMLFEVCAVGPGAYWAVGATALAERAGTTSLVAHYADGHWQQVGFEGVGPLFSVAATGPDDVWAVGQSQDPGQLGGALILHYDGHAWAPSETQVVGQAWLNDVACAGRDNVWAVGVQQSGDGPFGPLILHFDGSAWAAVEPPATAAPNGLSAVIALPDGAAWAAGGFSADRRHRLHDSAGHEHRGRPLRCACCSPPPGSPRSSMRSTSRRSLRRSPSRASTTPRRRRPSRYAPRRRVRPDVHPDPGRERGHRPCRPVADRGRAGRHRRHDQRPALQVRQHALPQAAGLPGSHPQRGGHGDTGALAARGQRAADSRLRPAQLRVHR